jgi:two-component system nitrogen regulation sensor histidine kinase NtrY
MNSELIFSTARLYFLLFLSAFSFIVLGLLLSHGVYFYAVIVFIAGLFITYRIISQYRYSNDSVSFFFESIRNNDTSIQFPVIKGNRQTTRLYDSMNQVIRYFQELKVQNESNEQYYKALIQYSATGLIVMNSENGIELINEIAARYSGISPETTNLKALEMKRPDLFRALCDLKPGENVTFRNISNGEVQFLFFRATILRRYEESVKLISIQDIRQELESKELESYRKLISVLTHEIMNLIAPITAVSRSLYSLYTERSRDEQKTDIYMHTINSLQVIEEQSSGIMNFVNNYRKISKIPEPVLVSFSVNDWVEQLEIAFSGIMDKWGIHFQKSIDKTIKKINADKNLLNQVMINLFNNAIEAMSEIKGERIISLKVGLYKQNKVVIKLINNGPYIPPDIQEKIFVPFFTTKKNGSGIGLSISQEIIKMHQGSLSMISVPDNHTSFIIELFK